MKKIEQRFDGVPMLKLDGGNFRDVASPAGDRRTEALLEAMQILGYDVVNLGERDVRLGSEEFRERTRATPLTFVSANFVRADTGEPVFSPHVVIEAASPDGRAKRRVGVTGVVRSNPLFREAGPAGSEMVIADPVERVRVEVARLQEKEVDTIIVLAALHRIHARKIVEQVDGIDWLLGSHGDTLMPAPERVGDSRILYAGNRGQHLAEARLFFDDPDKSTTRLHYLDNVYSHDPAMLDFVNSIYNKEKPDEPEPACEDDGGPSSGPAS